MNSEVLDFCKGSNHSVRNGTTHNPNYTPHTHFLNVLLLKYMIATTASMITITTTAELMPTTVDTVLDLESGSSIVIAEIVCQTHRNDSYIFSRKIV